MLPLPFQMMKGWGQATRWS